jgi:hypothetical protein
MADCRRRNGFTFRFHCGLPRFKNKKSNTFQNLTSMFRFDLMHWSVSIGPEMAYFRPFSNVISIKTYHAARKNTSNMAATIGDIRSSIAYL